MSGCKAAKCCYYNALTNAYMLYSVPKFTYLEVSSCYEYQGFLDSRFFK